MPKIPVKAEISLLIPICREKPDLSAVHEPDLWKTIRGCAVRHGMAPLIASAVRQHVPTAERGWCDRILAQSWASFQRSLRGLEFVAETLGRRGIQLLSLKGPLLASRYYNRPSRRSNAEGQRASWRAIWISRSGNATLMKPAPRFKRLVSDWSPQLKQRVRSVITL